ncbi:MAG: hypothetical protein Ct9H90mP20_7140 [Candidatus Neomarinimicrobiota bacterium]|nr:MAG: hypothetical protein Ct9H90mP20_7140 [Candidatus Neomarinimicrobiota bacterium]
MWTRGKFHYEKSLNSILEQKPKLSKTDLAFSYDIDNPSSVIAFKKSSRSNNE